MSKGNKAAKKELERIYGKGCFFVRARIAERIETTDELSFKRFVEYKRYRGKKISHRITYHHLVHKSERRQGNSREWSECRGNSTSILT